MINNSQANEIRQQYRLYKRKFEQFSNRVKSLEFVPIAAKVIRLSVTEGVPSNSQLTGLIQILRYRASDENVRKYLRTNIRDIAQRVELENAIVSRDLHFRGFTGAGLNSIYNLNLPQRKFVKELLLRADSARTINDAAEIIKWYEAKNVPLVTSGVYSPWLYYLNPTVFPILNQSHHNFLRWCNQPLKDYVNAITFFQQVAEIIGEKDLGMVDIFAHSFDEPIRASILDPVAGSGSMLSVSRRHHNSKLPLNQILHGPPGTGKTYQSIVHALSIIEGIPVEVLNKENRQDLKKKFDQLLIKEADGNDGQVAFLTFHQSMSYEDFVEGIKPLTDSGKVVYEVRPGIFKQVVRRAMSSGTSESYIANFETAYNILVEKIKSAANNSLVLETLHRSRPFSIYVNSKGNIRFHANTEKAYEGVIRKEFIKSYLETGIAQDWESYTSAVGEYLKSDCGYLLEENNLTSSKAFVLIIDEINRGNIAQIFGELITLIEDGKRLGQDEELKCLLPYSNTVFGVPDNLFIVGTMNTADRSVEALDTALRRRFVFQEMLPEPYLLSPKKLLERLWLDDEFIHVTWDDAGFRNRADRLYAFLGIDRVIENINGSGDELSEEQLLTAISEIDENSFRGINLEKLLSAINQRLAILLDKDHTIGHAWLLNVESLDDLKKAFRNKILPLLQEFFYNNIGKIGLVLGDAFVKASTVEASNFAVFKMADDYEGSLTTTRYELIPVDNLQLSDFMSIYQGSKKAYLHPTVAPVLNIDPANLETIKNGN